MTVGLPKALLYYRYGVLWEEFLRALGCGVVVSGETTKKILEEGSGLCVDESCLPLKIFMGHVASLVGKCDVILIPRASGNAKKRDVCVRFYALWDIVKNTLKDARLVCLEIDEGRGSYEVNGFIKLGRRLGYGRSESLAAYIRAEIFEKKYRERERVSLEGGLRRDGIKILIVSHPYNTCDSLIGRPVARYIEKLGATALFADRAGREECVLASHGATRSLNWVYSRELIGSVMLLRDMVDGIILLTAFPCGCDCLVNELITGEVKRVPVTGVVVDELQGEAGLQTRIESFMDILIEKKKKDAS